MKTVRQWLGILLVVFTFSACSSGGDSVPPPATPQFRFPQTTLTGRVTDTNLAPVENASVELIRSSISLRTFESDAAGRYTIDGIIVPGIEYTLVFRGPDSSYFPVLDKLTLVEDEPTVLDAYLPRATAQTVNAATGGTVTSETFIDAVEQSTLTLAAGDLEDSSGTAYSGTATVYITPIDVGDLGYGLARYEPNLDTVFSALAADAAIFDVFASAAVAIEDASQNELSLASSSSTLTMPVPASPSDLRANAPATISLYYLDPTSEAFVESGTASLDAGGDSYTGAISRTGVWIAAVKRPVAELTEVTGTLQYSDGTAAAGAVVYINGTDYAYQDTAVTDADGGFSLAAKTGGDVEIHAVIAANGAQLPYDRSITAVGAANAALGTISLPFAAPVADATASVTMTLDSGNTASDQIGYILAAGRQVYDDAGASANVTDITFLANAVPVLGDITLTPTQGGSGIQVVSGIAYDDLATAPTTGYVTSADAAADYTVDLTNASASSPILVAVKTAQGHYGKVSIDSVTNTGGTIWTVSFRHAFSLTGTF